METQIGYIKDIVENQYHITSPESYIEYKRKKGVSGITLEEINVLSPDTIDSGSFWKYIQEESIFGNDSIAYGFENNIEVERINEHNFRFACSTGVLNYMFHYSNMYYGYQLNLLDIGAGYGMLKDIVNKITQFKYYGIDVWPKFDDVQTIKNNEFPKEILNTKFGLIIATNVFQHMSVSQRREYYKQIIEILDSKGGIFSFNIIIETPTSRGFRCVNNNKQYMCHYGQYTEIQTFEEIADDLVKHFNILGTCARGNLVTFHCGSKNMEKTNGNKNKMPS